MEKNGQYFKGVLVTEFFQFPVGLSTTGNSQQIYETLVLFVALLKKKTVSKIATVW